jgi:hypothetical protein
MFLYIDPSLFPSSNTVYNYDILYNEFNGSLCH